MEQKKRVEALISYLIISDERKARALLYGVGYPHPHSLHEMKNYFMHWLQTDRADALKKIMQNHPDNASIQLVNDLSKVNDPTFPNPNHFATKARTYHDFQNYSNELQYPYTWQNLADQAYQRPPWQQYRAGVITGFSNYGGSELKSTSCMSIQNVLLLMLVLLFLYFLWKNK